LSSIWDAASSAALHATSCAPIRGFDDQTPIDRLVIGKWFFIQGTTIWDPVLFPDSFINDVAINLFVNPRTFAPGQEREFVFYVTLTPTNLDVQPPIALGVETLPVIEPNRRDLSKLLHRTGNSRWWQM
jgi:hypothetical protein